MIFYKFDLETYSQLIAAYNQPGRFYHNLEHIYDCLRKLSEYQAAGNIISTNELDGIIYAIWFHDVFYIPGYNKNESASAQIWQSWCKAKVGQSYVHDVSKLIESTKDHLAPHENGNVGDVFLDIDMSILGDPLPKYQKYAENIRKEYSSYGDEVYFAGRRKFLVKILKNAGKTFRTPFFKERCEAQAISNIVWELSTFPPEVNLETKQT